MERDSILNQLEIEQELISNIGSSLRRALDWPTDEDSAPRKLSTLRFIAESFHRHLERMMTIHEHNGYMAYVTNTHPELTPAVDRLREAHAELRRRLGRISTQLGGMAPGDLAGVCGACEDLRDLLKMYDAHAKNETLLIQDAMLQDIGGSG